MGVLKNPKHELFAQGIAKGSTGRDAYKAAGYATNGDAATDVNASRLLSDARVSARVAEIQSRAAARTEITVADITSRLLAIAAKGEVADDAPLLSVARASLMDAAKLNGLVVDKADTTLRGQFDGEINVNLVRPGGR